jgi:hypothetical protein
MSRPGEEVGARLVEHRAEERHAFLPRELAQLEPFGGGELERLAMLAVRAPERVLVVVRRVVERACVQAAVVPLLELHRIGAALPRRAHQRLRLLEVALVVVADLGDDIGRAVPRDDPAVDDQLAHGAMVLGGLGRSNAVHGDTAHLLPLEAETGRRLVERSLPRRSRRELRVEEHGADTELAERRDGLRVREPRRPPCAACRTRRVETAEAVHDVRKPSVDQYM